MLSERLNRLKRPAMRRVVTRAKTRAKARVVTRAKTRAKARVVTRAKTRAKARVVTRAKTKGEGGDEGQDEGQGEGGDEGQDEGQGDEEREGLLQRLRERLDSEEGGGEGYAEQVALNERLESLSDMRWPADSMISSRSIMQALSGIEDVWGGRARIRPTVLRVHDAPRLLIEDEAINRMAPSLGRLRGATKQRRTRVMRPSSPKLCIYLDVSGSMHKNTPAGPRRAEVACAWLLRVLEEAGKRAEIVTYHFGEKLREVTRENAMNSWFRDCTTCLNQLAPVVATRPRHKHICLTDGEYPYKALRADGLEKVVFVSVCPLNKPNPPANLAHWEDVSGIKRLLKGVGIG
jgi:hypothetical protein